MMRFVLALFCVFSVAVQAFPVSGSVFLRYNKNGVQFSQDGNNSVADLTWGLYSSGLSVNFDGFTLTYLLREPMTPVTAGSTNVLGWINLVGAPSELGNTSLGYLQFSGLRMGALQAAVGFQVNAMVYDEYRKETNQILTDDTNSYTAGNFAGYLDLVMNWKLTDGFAVGFRDSERAYVYYETGQSEEQSVGNSFQTNTFTGMKYRFVLPLYLDLGGGAFTYEVRGLFGMNGTDYRKEDLLNARTNIVLGSGIDYGVFVRGVYNLNESFGLWAWLSFDGSVSSVDAIEESPSPGTNRTVRNLMAAPLIAGIVYRMAPGIAWTIGLGYRVVVDDTTLSYDVGILTTNVVKNGSVLTSTDHWHNPWLAVGATGKAGEFEAGIHFNLELNPQSRAQENYEIPGAYTATGGDSVLNFVNTVNYDDNVYIKWSKDMLEFKGVLGTGALAGEIMNLFGSFTMTVKF